MIVSVICTHLLFVLLLKSFVESVSIECLLCINHFGVEKGEIESLESDDQASTNPHSLHTKAPTVF